MITKRRFKIFGLLRVMLLCAAISFAITALSVGSVYGEARESTLAAGRSLLELKDVIGESTTLDINGNTVFAGGHYIPLDVHSVLDKVEAHCKSGAWNFRDELLQLAASKQQELPREALSFDIGVMRQETEQEGAVVCMLAPKSAKGIQAFLAGLEHLAATGDISKLGDARYVYAKRHPRGGTNTVHIWSEGRLNLFSLLPTDGDAEGRDMDDIQRPPGSKRVLSAAIRGGQHALWTYATSQTSDAVLAHYDQVLPKQGYRNVAPLIPKDAPAEARAELARTRTFMKNGAAMLLFTTTHDSETRAHFIQLGSRGAVTVPIAE